jgi:hypothetical protein
VPSNNSETKDSESLMILIRVSFYLGTQLVNL